MEKDLQRNLLIEEIKAFLSILDSKGVAFDAIAVDDQSLGKLNIGDLKHLNGILRDLARTPTGAQ
jgi:hypothetical protein